MSRSSWKDNFELFQELGSNEQAVSKFSSILQKTPDFFKYTTPPSVIRFLAKFIQDQSASTILDPASGTGSLLAYTKRISGAENGYGYDISPNVIDHSLELFPDLNFQTRDTSKLFSCPKVPDLIVSALPVGVKLSTPFILHKEVKSVIDSNNGTHYVSTVDSLRLVSDAIMYNSLKQLSEKGMAIFLTNHSLLSRNDSKKMIKILQSEGIFLNAAISISSPNIPSTGLKYLMCIFSRISHGEIFFAGCENVKSDILLSHYKSKEEVGGVCTWSSLNDFIRFNDKGIPIINDSKIHKKNLQASLISSASLYEYFTLEDLVIEHEFTSKGELKRENWDNVVFLRKDNPVSTINKQDAIKWKRGYVAIELDNEKVNNKYLDYLFTRSVGKYMLDTIIHGNVVRSINKKLFLSMPLLLPNLDTQDNVVNIRNEIDKKMNELKEMKNLLHRLDNPESIRNELEKIKTSNDNLESLLYLEEGSKLEFKSSLWRKFKGNEPIMEQTSKDLKLEDAVIKTICAFLNTEGGTLLIGVSDTKLSDGRSIITGIEEDYIWCKKNNPNQDGFGQSIENIIRDKLTSSLTPLEKHISKSFHIADGKTICKIDVIPAPTNGHGYAVFAKVSKVNEKRLFIRSGETTTMQSPESQTNYIVGHFMGEED
jgi:predicted HTH transcriptional regulator